jgi:plastocyanin
MNLPRFFGATLLAMLLAGTSATFAADHEVELFDFFYRPAVLNIEVGDRVTWRNVQGFHNVVSDTGLFSSGDPVGGNWTFSHTFDEPGDFPYFCSLHGNPGGIGMAGRIVVAAQEPPPEPEPTHQICFETSGAWFNPQTSGQGFLIDVSPAIGLFFVAWFTWQEEAGAHDWLTIQGGFEGNRAEAPILRSSGGRFNDPTETEIEQVGMAVFEFADCGSGTMEFNFDDGPQGSIDIVRLTPVPPRCLEVCQSEE